MTITKRPTITGVASPVLNGKTNGSATLRGGAERPMDQLGYEQNMIAKVQ